MSISATLQAQLALVEAAITANLTEQGKVSQTEYYRIRGGSGDREHRIALLDKRLDSLMKWQERLSKQIARAGSSPVRLGSLKRAGVLDRS